MYDPNAPNYGFTARDYEVIIYYISYNKWLRDDKQLGGPGGDFMQIEHEQMHKDENFKFVGIVEDVKRKLYLLNKYGNEFHVEKEQS
ncbi:hypothetical protein WICPIJ_004335 [Wickerhamomyces pijperi]|uniref:Uncharacterized protein n=1 Tax=Wickerhamomyces pijperi TaxID=599730 RepID=A0A9P8Q854_WICPI|nr:hypothetical protein WICPIJ_004335 [Wickerhamomyces pijperi]